ncbi:MAG: hypothetical protein KDE19_14685 [Caldilineaceae bacterium]|nr:hypothetical protein [Caldilineaceae bacterium]
MLSLELPPLLEQKFKKVVQDSYQGDSQAAISALLQLHAKYGWKEQLNQDVTVIRKKVHQSGGVSEQAIEDAIQRYREQLTT